MNFKLMMRREEILLCINHNNSKKVVHNIKTHEEVSPTDTR